MVGADISNAGVTGFTGAATDVLWPCEVLYCEHTAKSDPTHSARKTFGNKAIVSPMSMSFSKPSVDVDTFKYMCTVNLFVHVQIA